MGRRIDPSWWIHSAISRFQHVFHDWYNKGGGMWYSLFGLVHIKEPLLLIGKSSQFGGIGFPLSLSEWSFNICRRIDIFWLTHSVVANVVAAAGFLSRYMNGPLPYVRHQIIVNKMCVLSSFLPSFLPSLVIYFGSE